MNEDVIENSNEDEEEGNGTDFVYDENGELLDVISEEFLPKDMENAPEDQWSIQGIWNEIVNLERREPKARDYISFSDIGKKDLWSRYMKMKGVAETNPFDPRVMRVFQAGDEFHDLIKTIFKKVGIFINSQDDLDKAGQLQWSEIPATGQKLKQFGAYDILVGGVPDLEKALKWIEESDLSHMSKQKAERIARYFAEKFPNGLKPLLYEVKSINSMAFWGKKSYLTEAYPHHRHQAFGYLRANQDKVSEARLLYISKDDLTMAEFPITLDDEKLAQSYDKDIEQISYFYLNNIEPPKPDYIIFNPRKMFSFSDKKIKYRIKGSYEINWEVIRSPYFTLMTGFKTQREFELLVKGELQEKNKGIKAKVLTKVNLSTTNSKNKII